MGCSCGGGVDRRLANSIKARIAEALRGPIPFICVNSANVASVNSLREG